MKGSCLCSSVQFEITAPFKGFQYCFCSRCRKLSGSAHGANIFVPSEQFHWLKGEEKIALFKLPEAKRFSSCFCTQCGSPLPWIVPGGKNYIVPAGAIDDGLNDKPAIGIFWESKASWFVETCDIQKFDELPIKQ